jgi:hypothetical protein
MHALWQNMGLFVIVCIVFILLFFLLTLFSVLFDAFFSGLAHFNIDHLQRDLNGNIVFPAIPKEKSKQQLN